NNHKGMNDPLLTPVQFVKGVGPVLGSLLEKKGIRTVADLFTYFPHRYLDRRRVDTLRTLTPGKEKCVIAEVVGCASRPLGRSRRRIFEMTVADSTGVAIIVWFHFNERYLKKIYTPGKKILIAGECALYGLQKQFTHPEIEIWDEEGPAHPIVPVYPLTDGLYQKTIRKIVANALEKYLESLEETPLSVREGEVKISLKDSLRSIHHPPADADVALLDEQRSVWHQRVIYDELFFLQLGLGLKKIGIKKDHAVPFPPSKNLAPKALGLIPFELTGAQKKVLGEITADLAKGEPANRLLQGDVGSGKTLVAFLAALQAVEAGYQAAIMAPTEILAGQHFRNLEALSRDLGVKTALLTRTTPRLEKEAVLAGLVEGKIGIVFGTHALIQDDVVFKNLGFIVIDEQHRFGVMQRAQLKRKGIPHILVMTATPIPRTLAMAVYGDLDISIIDELPKGRKPIATHVFNEKMRPRAYDLVHHELQKGHQAYFVYPLIEESEKSDLKDATAMAENLKEVFPKFKVALLHGRMKGEEKTEIMARFKKNETQILVSTTVIEVGIDVPNSTVMVVEHAERFGLSQLHQLRGRVGRGGEQSFCLLMAGYAQSEETRYRLRVMEETNDGFKVAEEDLKLRGPGDFLGTRQSGLPEFRLAHLARDAHLLTAARARAFQILEEDPALAKPEHAILRKILAQRWESKLELGDIS
ncbi:MAG: ATP-dependent DNA helicase RecG, partial [Deltaproteobacteria bacterium]|nr:ATP-dependent DNA helicase RecG [Deltaproteobacteria bacterium]